VGPRYKAAQGETEPPQSRRIDPELEAAQEALQSLGDDYELRDAENAIGHRVELSTPLSYGTGQEGLNDAEEAFLKDLGPRLERVLLARGFVIRIGAELTSQDGSLDQAAAALAAAERVRARLIEGMEPGVQALAQRRMYTFLRAAPPEAAARDGEKPWQLKVDVLLTKPYVEEASEEGTGSNETEGAG
jgi:hypothetical protein